MTVSGDTTRYEHDANGNLTRESLSRYFEWDYADRLRGYRNQAGAGPASLATQYLYDAAGQRVKKLVRAGGKVTVTVYVDGGFERCRTFGVGSAVENDTVHVIDGKSRIALVRLGPAFPRDATPTVQYHLSDHLGSSHVVLDASGSGVGHEEYTPYGETSFGSHTRKRYRYSGKERDEESGLYYFGLRYYAPWLARWASTDPVGPVDGVNLYAYVRCNPMRLSDAVGLQSADNITDAGAPRSDLEEAKPPGAAATPGGADTGPTGGAPNEYDPSAEKQYTEHVVQETEHVLHQVNDYEKGVEAGFVNHVVKDAPKVLLGPHWDPYGAVCSTIHSQPRWKRESRAFANRSRWPRRLAPPAASDPKSERVSRSPFRRS